MAAAAGDGLALTPFNDMLDGMRAAMSVSRKDLLLEATSASAAEGNNAASSIKQRLTKGTGDGAALTQAEEMGTAGTGLAKAAEKEVASVGKGRIDHATKRHLPEKVQHEIPFQLKKHSREYVEASITERSYFNKNWDREKVERAVEIVLDEAIKAWINNDKYSMQVFGEKVTVYINKDGCLRTAYGDHCYNLSDFGY